MNPGSSIYKLFFICLVTGCTSATVDKEPDLPAFESNPVSYVLDNQSLTGISGVVPSLAFENSLWIHNDHDTHLYLISNDGQLQKSYALPREVRDWEDIAIGPGPESGINYLYLGDIGDNNETYGEYTIYRIPEPQGSEEQISSFDSIPFRYGDGKNYDVEAMLLDPQTRDIYLLTKRQIVQSHVFKISYPHKTNDWNVAEHIFSIPYGMLTGGDISFDRKNLVLKNYTTIFYWKIKEGESIEKTLQRTSDLQAPYRNEPQGEAICFDRNSSGYFTISEKGNSTEPVTLFYYPRSTQSK